MDSDEDEDHHGFVGFNAKTSSPDKMPAQGETLDVSLSLLNAPAVLLVMLGIGGEGRRGYGR